jgi:hypothetical protein
MILYGTGRFDHLELEFLSQELQVVDEPQLWVKVNESGVDLNQSLEDQFQEGENPLWKLKIIFLCSGACTIKLFTDFRNKLKCLSTTSLSSLV